MPETKNKSARIEDYGLIGNLKTVALVSVDCSIDTDEATAFIKWIHDRCQDDKLHLMYTLSGQHDI